MNRRLLRDGIEIRKSDVQFDTAGLYILYVSISLLRARAADQMSNLLSAFDLQPVVASH